MEIREIESGIYYIGVDDRREHLFESLWPIPYGVSYNSYLVTGDKTAIIDSVEINFRDQLFEYLESRKIVPDYIVVNHMEPDHSGSLPFLLEKYPNLKIVGNRITIGMVKGFYHITDDNCFYEVANGDVLDLGQGKELTFYTTPLLHWPETMMTWIGGNGILFSGDAFGCFGALDGKVLDSDMDTCVYLEEMRRYYAAIVGKYGKNVQAAFRKLADLPIKYICPTHGPIWHERAKEVIAIYDRMSKYETANQGVVIVYGSMYGNTERAVKYLANALIKCGVEPVKVFNVSESEPSEMLAAVWESKGLVVASPTYSMDIFPAIDGFVKSLEIRELKNRYVGLIGCYAWAPEALKKLTARFGALDVEIVGDVSIKMSMDDTTPKLLDELAENLSKKLLGNE